MDRKFCCNFSNELEALIKEEKVKVDYIKPIPLNGDLKDDFTWIDRCLKFENILLHGFMPNNESPCSDKFIDNFNLDKFMYYVNSTKTPYISGHISATYDDYDYKHNDKKLKHQILDTCISNINYLKENVNHKLLLENHPFSFSDVIIECVSESKFINTVIKETDTEFLLDIAHAKVTSYTKNIDLVKYINSLPLDKTSEVHLSGISKLENGDYYDTHTKMDKHDYDLLDYVLKNTPVKYITLEYSPDDLSANHINPKYKEELYEQICTIKNLV